MLLSVALLAGAWPARKRPASSPMLAGRSARVRAWKWLPFSSKPVAAVPGQKAFRSGPFPTDGGDAVGGLGGGLPGLRDGALADDAEHLADLAERQRCRRQRARIDALALDAAGPFAAPVSWRRTAGASQSRPRSAANVSGQLPLTASR